MIFPFVFYDRNIMMNVMEDRLSKEKRNEFNQSDLLKYGLIGSENSSEKRDEIGKILGIGYGNSKQFLNRINNYGVTREEFEKAAIKVCR